ncbi:capsule polysaccharide synthase Cps1 [Apiospora saccharicola]|uniref:Capsule polysaccharide synthase Cps1 n=1 Tax=Apiospora saccharicola TaxID=335842 RepID=A0ABR1UNT2_9PEZI
MAPSPWVMWPLAFSGLASVLGFITITCPYLLGVRFIWGWPLTASLAFIALIIFINLRKFVHWVVHQWYKPYPMVANPTFKPSRDVTVVIPTVEPGDPTFRRCLKSVCINTPARVYIVTVGKALQQVAEKAMEAVRGDHPGVDIQVCHTPVANKRRQLDFVVKDFVNPIETPITFHVDSTAIWPAGFLPQALAPFEDPEIGLVGTSKRVERLESGTSSELSWNRRGAFYLERHNYECESSDALGGGHFIISGRTEGIRTSILQDENFRQGYLDERICLGMPFLPDAINNIGPIVADDDNYILRWCVDHDIGVKFQSNFNSKGTGIDDNCVVRIADMGKHHRYYGQCLRWARTTFRSNPRTLLSWHAWRRHPWSMYGVQLATLTNFAAVQDPLQIYLFRQVLYSLISDSTYRAWGLAGLVALILCSKTIKLMSWLRRYPSDCIYLPSQIVFVYVHSGIKLRAMLTFWNVEWAGRDLDKVNRQAQKADTKRSAVTEQTRQ